MGSTPAFTTDRIRNVVVLGHGGAGKAGEGEKVRSEKFEVRTRSRMISAFQRSYFLLLTSYFPNRRFTASQLTTFHHAAT